MTYTLRMIPQDAWKDSTTADMWWESLSQARREEIAAKGGWDNRLVMFSEDWWYGLTSDQAVRIWRAQTQGAER